MAGNPCKHLYIAGSVHLARQRRVHNTQFWKVGTSLSIWDRFVTAPNSYRNEHKDHFYVPYRIWHWVDSAGDIEKKIRDHLEPYNVEERYNSIPYPNETFAGLSIQELVAKVQKFLPTPLEPLDLEKDVPEMGELFDVYQSQKGNVQDGPTATRMIKLMHRLTVTPPEPMGNPPKAA